MQFARHGDETVCLALEVILNHQCARSRFLRGASLQWDPIDIGDATPLRDLHPQRSDTHLVDKVVSLEDTQQAVFDTPARLVLVVLVGSAGLSATGAPSPLTAAA